MGNLTLNGATSGQITLAPTAVAGTNTLTLPATTGNIITSADTGTVSQTMLATNVAGNGPAFSAYQNSNQTITNSTWTKLQFQAEYFDTANCFDSTTNYRFTPNVAGYYFVSASARTNVTATGELMIAIYKNGSEFMRGGNLSLQTWALASYQPNVNVVMYLNGSSDYVEAYYLQTTGVSVTSQGSANITYFNGALVRAA